jgi:hypothetical protein
VQEYYTKEVQTAAPVERVYYTKEVQTTAVSPPLLPTAPASAAPALPTLDGAADGKREEENEDEADKSMRQEEEQLEREIEEGLRGECCWLRRGNGLCRGCRQTEAGASEGMSVAVSSVAAAAPLCCWRPGKLCTACQQATFSVELWVG